MLKLYGANISPFVRKPGCFSRKKGCHTSTNNCRPSSERETSSAESLGKNSCLPDGDKTLADSSIICAYLEKTHPQPALYPSDPYDYARALYFEEYGDGGLAPIVGASSFLTKSSVPC